MVGDTPTSPHTPLWRAWVQICLFFLSQLQMLSDAVKKTTLVA
jgi:hypothetical protein